MRVRNVLLALLLSISSGMVRAQSSSAPPDNTKVNKRDRKAGEPTADQQKENPNDRELTRKIRRALVADKSLSTYAHNIKIISEHGTVTLKGPVHSEDEKKAVMAKAQTVVGSADKIRDEISVKP